MFFYIFQLYIFELSGMMSTIGEWTLASPDSSGTIGLESPEELMLHLSYKVKKKKKEKKTQENVDLSSQLQIEYN